MCGALRCPSNLCNTHPPLPPASCQHSPSRAWPTELCTEPVFSSIDEKLSCVLNKQGGVESLEVQGTLSLVVATDADAFIRAKVRAAGLRHGRGAGGSRGAWGQALAVGL